MRLIHQLHLHHEMIPLLLYGQIDICIQLLCTRSIFNDTSCNLKYHDGFSISITKAPFQKFKTKRGNQNFNK